MVTTLEFGTKKNRRSVMPVLEVSSRKAKIRGSKNKTGRATPARPVLNADSIEPTITCRLSQPSR
jgi:hypothetical protein